MAQDRTSGFDMLVQISEAELNAQLATAFLAGEIFPPSMSVPVSSGGLTGTADLIFGLPVLDLDRPRPRVGLRVPFADSQLVVTAPVPLTIAPLAGVIEIVDRVEIITDGPDQIIALDFAGGAPDVAVTFDAASQAVLAPFLAATGMTLEQAQNQMAAAVAAHLRDELRRLDLSPPIPTSDDTDPTTIFDLDVTTINDNAAADRDCMCIGVRMASDSGGNINQVTNNFIPAGSQSMVMMSNFWLLARVMRPRVAAALGTAVTNFDTPLRLNRNIPAPGGQGRLTRLVAFIEGNRIRVEGRATASDTGWSAVSNFTFFITIGLNTAGELTVTASAPQVDTDVDLEWWVWLVSLGLGALFGGIIGAIIAAIVLAVVEAVAEGIVDNLVGDGIGGSLGNIPPVPLGPIGGGLALASVILDDLELRCSILRSLSVPIKSQGTHVAGAGPAAGFWADLDAGVTGGSGLPSADLVWDPATGLSTRGGAGLTVTGASFASLTPPELAAMPLASAGIPAPLIPFPSPVDALFGGSTGVVFGVRTSEGRLAKARAWRSFAAPFPLRLQWTTFDTPHPSLNIAARWSIAERGEQHEYITPDCSRCRSGPVRRRGVFEARPRLMPFPIDLQWCLCGQVIAEGSGTVNSPDGPLAYELNGRRLVVTTEMGQGVDCELCVSAIDGHGREFFTCIRLSQSGVETRCEKCEPRKSKFLLEMLQRERVLAAWRPVLTGQLAVASGGPA